MGYYTRYDLSVIDGDPSLIEELIEECEEASFAIDGNGDSIGDCKWYSHNDDLKHFSAKHPSVLFKLYGEGEEPCDLWAKYFKQGKMQYCKAKISFQDFDESLLK